MGSGTPKPSEGFSAFYERRLRQRTGYAHTCILFESKQLKCYGRNDFGLKQSVSLETGAARLWRHSRSRAKLRPARFKVAVLLLVDAHGTLVSLDGTPP
eukprot:3639913-Amphidinium_carterae.1